MPRFSTSFHGVSTHAGLRKERPVVMCTRSDEALCSLAHVVQGTKSVENLMDRPSAEAASARRINTEPFSLPHTRNRYFKSNPTPRIIISARDPYYRTAEGGAVNRLRTRPRILGAITFQWQHYRHGAALCFNRVADRNHGGDFAQSYSCCSVMGMKIPR